MKPRNLWPRWLMAIALLCGATLTSAGTLENIKTRGTLKCAVSGDVPGMSLHSEDDWSGMDVDFCRGLAAAVLGDASKVDFIATPAAERLSRLTDGSVDVLAANASWTEARELGEQVRFVGVLYYDGQGFLVPRASGKHSTLELANSKICALSGTTSLSNAKRYFTRHRMPMELVLFDDLPAASDAYLEGRCDTITIDKSQLHGLRAIFPDPDEHRILPEVISREPLSPAVRPDDSQWFALVRWTLFTLINAEEFGVDSGNLAGVSERAKSDEIRTLLGYDSKINASLGIESGWGERIIAAVGNYQELFERNLGKASGLDIKRGLNDLWNQGGLLYAPPPR